MKFSIVILIFLIIPSVTEAQQQEKSMVSYTHYLLYVPEYLPKNGHYPLLLFLHGSGARGNDLNLLKSAGPPSFLDGKIDFPFVVVSPQCPENRNWDNENLLALLDHIEATLPIDSDKIYVTGYSMGGFGTWSLAQAAPDRFAAIAPVCGGGNPDRICIMRNISVWAFHGAKDTEVPYNESERMVLGLRDLGSDVKFTLYPELGHDCWTETYANKELYDWMLSKSRTGILNNVDESTLKSYAGRYKYSDDEFMEVTYENRNLFVKSSVANRKLEIVPFAVTKFRIPGPFGGDSEMYFKVSKNGVVEGFTVGPCDGTFCPSF